MYQEEYKEYLKTVKKVSDNTMQAYLRDLSHFVVFLNQRGVRDAVDASNGDALSYMMDLKSRNMSKSTVNRKLASLRTYYDFLIKDGYIKVNPTDNIKSPKIEKKKIEFLSIEEIEKILSLPDDTPKGKRDKAILELLYATGIRATELIEMKLDDVNMRMGFVKCKGDHSKARIIPMGRICRTALENFVFDIRPEMAKDDSKYLFVNYNGQQLTRQGLWKILKEYGEEAEISIGLTPQVIRNSFAVHMLQNGADVKSLQELMGHEDIAATQAYLAVTKNRIKDVYDRAHPRA